MHYSVETGDADMARKSTRRPAPSNSAGTSRKRHARSVSRASTHSARKWSRRVTRTSNALDLEQGVFKLDNPKKIAASLKRSAEASKRRKADPYRSALSMLTFYVNRAGKNLSASRKKTLNHAKVELKAQFGRL
jgi:transposase-like protein